MSNACHPRPATGLSELHRTLNRLQRDYPPPPGWGPWHIPPDVLRIECHSIDERWTMLRIAPNGCERFIVPCSGLWANESPRRLWEQFDKIRDQIG